MKCSKGDYKFKPGYKDVNWTQRQAPPGRPELVLGIWEKDGKCYRGMETVIGYHWAISGTATWLCCCYKDGFSYVGSVTTPADETKCTAKEKKAGPFDTGMHLPSVEDYDAAVKKIKAKADAMGGTNFSHFVWGQSTIGASRKCQDVP